MPIPPLRQPWQSQYEPRAPNAATSRCAILPMFRGKEETGGQDSRSDVRFSPSPSPSVVSGQCAGLCGVRLAQ